MKGYSLAVFAFVAWLVLPCAWAADEGPADGPKVQIQCQLLFEATVEMSGPSNIPAEVTGELRAAIQKGSMQRKTVLLEFYGVLSSSPGPLEYDVVVASSTWEPELRGDPGLLARREEYQGMIARGEAHRDLKVDHRGRIMIAPATNTAEDYAGDELEASSDALFPPLPEEGDPFREGAEWSVPANGLWIPAGGPARCESVKVWTSGETEIVVTLHSELGPGAAAAALGLSATAEKRWVLRGNPPHVVEYSSHEVKKNSKMVTRIDRHGQVIWGGIPVRPVDRPSLNEE